MFSKKNLKVGDMVIFCDGKSHRDYPEYYPPIGTVGVIQGCECGDYLIQWPDGTTSLEDKWFCGKNQIHKR